MKLDNESKYNTRAELLLDSLNDSLLSLWCKTEEEKLDYVKWLLEEDEKDSERIFNDTLHDEIIKKKIKKMKPAKNSREVVKQIQQIKKIRRKKSHKTALKGMDRGIARYLDPKYHNKKYLNRDEYRKDLKRLAKMHRKEENVFDINDFEKQLQDGNIDMMDLILSDEYAIKHHI